MKRREFIGLLGAATVLPLAARAQQGEHTRRIGVLMDIAAEGPEAGAGSGKRRRSPDLFSVTSL